MVIAIEAGWLDRVRTTTLYRYIMPEEPFHLIDATAGHWIAREVVTPVSMEPVGDLLAALADADVELRVTPAIIPLWQDVIRSTLAFSGTRLRNARGYESLSLDPQGQTSAAAHGMDDRGETALGEPPR